MKSGIVMEIKRRHAMVFNQDCGLVRVPVRRNMFVGQSIALDADRLPADAKAATPSVRTMAPARRRFAGLAAAVACMVLLGTGGVFLNGVVSARAVAVVMSVDVNPSIDLMLNRDHQVLRVQARNEEAARLLEGVALQGLDYEAAVERWIQTLRERWEGELSQVLVSAAFLKPDEAFANVLLGLEEIPAAGPLAGLDMWVVYSNNKQVVSDAEANGLSIGRQLLLNLSYGEQPGANPSQIADEPLGDMIQTMLRRGQPDLSTEPAQNGSTTRSASDPVGSTGATIRQTDRETVQSGQGSTESNRETNRETQGGGSPATVRSGEQQQATSGVGSTPTLSGTPTTARLTEQSTIRLTDPTGTGIPSPSTLHSGTGSTSGPGPGGQ